MAILPVSKHFAFLFETGSSSITLITKNEKEERNTIPLLNVVEQISLVDEKRLLVTEKGRIRLYDLSNGKVSNNVLKIPKEGYSPFGICVNSYTKSVWIGFCTDKPKSHGLIYRYDIDSFLLSKDSCFDFDIHIPRKITSNTQGSTVGVLNETNNGSRELLIFKVNGGVQVRYRSSVKRKEPMLIDFAISENEDIFILNAKSEIKLLVGTEYQIMECISGVDRRIKIDGMCTAIGISQSNTLWIRCYPDSIQTFDVLGFYDHRTNSSGVYTDSDVSRASPSSSSDLHSVMLSLPGIQWENHELYTELSDVNRHQDQESDGTMQSEVKSAMAGEFFNVAQMKDADQTTTQTTVHLNKSPHPHPRYLVNIYLAILLLWRSK